MRGQEEGLPELGNGEIELHSASGQASDAFTAFSRCLERLAARHLPATTCSAGRSDERLKPDAVYEANTQRGSITRQGAR